MLGMNFEMVKGLLERLVVFAVVALVSSGALPEALQDQATELGILAVTLIGSVFFGVKLNTSSSLASASKVAAAAATSTTKEVIKEAEDTVKELKGTPVE